MRQNRVRRVCVCAMAMMLLTMTGCAGYFEYMQRTRSPYGNTAQTITRYESRDYEVLGIVMAGGYSRCIMGIIIEGEEGDALLWNEARRLYGDRVTGIKDISMSYDYQSILAPVFSEIQTTYVGTAVRDK
jgi:uncharacterized SAM-binding protein YcdF (DUF218 family)